MSTRNAADPPLSLLYDPVFKAVFTKDSDASRGALRNLLSAIIGRDLAVIDLTANEPAVDDITERQIRYDINCKVRDTGEPLNIEMTLWAADDEELRLEYFVSKLFCSQGIKGKTYADLKRTYQISFIAHGRFFPKESLFNDQEFMHTFQYYDIEHKTDLGGRTRIITLELDKLQGILEKPVEKMSRREHWGVFFKYHLDETKRELIDRILQDEEGILMAQEAYSGITQDEREQARLTSELKFILDSRALQSTADRVMKEARKEVERAREEVERAREEARKEVERAKKEAREEAKKEIQALTQEREQAARKIAELQRQIQVRGAGPSASSGGV
jgi:hypothetical protein